MLKPLGTAAQASPAPSSTATMTPSQILVSVPLATGWSGTRVISVMGNPCGIAPHKQKGAEIDRALMAYPLMGFKRFA